MYRYWKRVPLPPRLTQRVVRRSPKLLPRRKEQNQAYDRDPERACDERPYVLHFIPHVIVLAHFVIKCSQGR